MKNPTVLCKLFLVTPGPTLSRKSVWENPPVGVRRRIPASNPRSITLLSFISWCIVTVLPDAFKPTYFKPFQNHWKTRNKLRPTWLMFPQVPLSFRPSLKRTSTRWSTSPRSRHTRPTSAWSTCTASPSLTTATSSCSPLTASTLKPWPWTSASGSRARLSRISSSDARNSRLFFYIMQVICLFLLKFKNVFMSALSGGRSL